MLALVLSVPAGESELAADALWALGVLAVEERSTGEPASGTDDQLVELWTSLGDDVEAITQAATAFPARWRWRLVTIDESVADTWRRHAVATWIERDLVVHPAWVPMEVAPGTVAVAIEPGATFGLGDHPTTVLTLRAMRTALFPGATVLDVGCGSGVLGIVACVLGASRAEAIDISPAAVPVTVANAERNGVGGAVWASTTPLAEVDGEFDIVMANILAPALIALAPELRRTLADDGVLIVSGMLAGHDAHVRAALEPLQVIDERERDGWVALSLRR